jgi:signal transduction histidine kinase
MSHELRNPLTPVRTSLAILDRVDPTGEQATRAREVIKRQISSFARLIDDLLDASRIAAGKIRPHLGDVELGALLRSAADDHRGVMREAGLEFVVHTPDAPLTVRGDETRILQIVGNLLQNASKFTPKGGRVELSASSDGRNAVIRVSDSGKGISPSLLPHLFEPFTQAEQNFARTEGGLGLGLSTVKGLTDLHGGEVTGESPGPNQGSTFTVRLPLAARPSDAQGDDACPAPTGGSTLYS